MCLMWIPLGGFVRGNRPMDEHYLSPCFALCVYFARPVVSSYALVQEVLKQLPVLGESSEIDVGYLSGRGSALAGRPHRERYSLVQFISLDTANDMARRNNDLVQIISSEAVQVGSFRFNKIVLNYSLNDGWGIRHSSSFGGPSLSLGIPLCSVSRRGGFSRDFLGNVVAVCAKFGEVCHGVIDMDYYIANRQGYYYSMRNWPMLRSRRLAAESWGQANGGDRLRLVRDPREGLVVGPGLAAVMPLNQLAAQDDMTEFPALLRKAGDASGYIVWSVPEQFGFDDSLRSSSDTEAKSRALFRRLCRLGYSVPSYCIQGEQDVGAAIEWGWGPEFDW